MPLSTRRQTPVVCSTPPPSSTPSNMPFVPGETEVIVFSSPPATKIWLLPTGAQATSPASRTPEARREEDGRIFVAVSVGAVQPGIDVLDPTSTVIGQIQVLVDAVAARPVGSIAFVAGFQAASMTPVVVIRHMCLDRRTHRLLNLRVRDQDLASTQIGDPGWIDGLGIERCLLDIGRHFNG